MGVIQRYMGSSTDPIVIGDSYFVFYNRLPEGPVGSLLSPERVKVTYADFDNKVRCQPGDFAGDGVRLAYFCVPGDTDILQLLHVLSVFNDISVEVTVYGEPEIMNGVRDYCNSNIRLVDLTALQDGLAVTADCVVASSPAALYFCRQEIPVIVAGPLGLGGWITPENFPYLSRNGFCGRPGGNQWETIPTQAFMGELRGVQYSTDRPAVLAATCTLAKESAFIPHSGLAGLTAEIGRHLDRIGSATEKWELVPAFATNILFVQGRVKSYIRRRGLNDTIATMDDLDFMRNIDGKKTFAELFPLFGDDDEAFWELMDELIQKKIIIF